jgi:hypothetical protein
MDCGAFLHTHIMSSSKQCAIFGDQRSPNLEQSYLSTGNLSPNYNHGRGVYRHAAFFEANLSLFHGNGKSFLVVHDCQGNCGDDFKQRESAI